MKLPTQPRTGTAICIAGGLLLISIPAHAQLARVTATERLTEKRLGTALWQKAARGEALGVGDGLRTGRRSKADLKFADGSLLRLGQLSTVELKSAKGASLTGGRLLFSMLKPGRVLAGTAAAEIKGSVGIISINQNGSAEFTLYSGAMDVVTERETVSIPPGQAMTVFADGSRSQVRNAPPLRSVATSGESSLLEAPSQAPFIGSRSDLEGRFSSNRLAVDSFGAALKQRNATPFPSPVVAAPVTPPATPPIVPPTVPPVTPPITPPTVPPPVVPPVTPPVTPPTNPPVVPPVTPPVTPPVVPPVTPPPVIPPVTPPVTPPVVPPGGGNDDDDDDNDDDDDDDDDNSGKDKDDDKDDDPDDGNNGGGNDDKDNDRVLAGTRFARSNITVPTKGSPTVGGRSVTPSFSLNGIALRFSSNQGAESPRLAMAPPDSVRVARVLPAPPPIPEGTTAEEHILQSDPGLGRAFGIDATGVALAGDRGSRAAGARLRAIARRGRISAEIAISPTQLRFGGDNRRRVSLSDASLTMRLRGGSLQVGRQRFLSGPTLATLTGSMVRQGGRQIMDAITFRPTLSTGNSLEIAYLNDAFVRDLPFRVRGRQQGFYGRFGIERRTGNFGLNVLNLSELPGGNGTRNGTGATLDFALPVVRDNVEFYGEVGRDPLRRSLRTFGLAFPGLQTRTRLELYLEHSALGDVEDVLESPRELALLLYKPLTAGVFLTGGFSRFSDGRNAGTFGLAFGAPSSGN